MSVESSQPKEYEVTDRDISLPVVSPQYLLGQILDRLTALEEETAALRERDRLRKERITTLEEENRALREEIALERAYDRQRLARLEAPAPALREETAAAHLDCLFSEMRRLNIKQTTIKDAARLLGVSKPLMKKLKPYLATDSRFVVMKDSHHKQRHLIRLTGM